MKHAIFFASIFAVLAACIDYANNASISYMSFLIGAVVGMIIDGLYIQYTRKSWSIFQMKIPMK